MEYTLTQEDVNNFILIAREKTESGIRKKGFSQKVDFVKMTTCDVFIDIYHEIPFQEIYDCSKDFNEYKDMLAEAILIKDSLDRKLELKQARTSRYDLIKEFKEELRIIIEVKSKFEPSERFDNLKKLMNNEKNIDVEKASDTPMERVLDSMGIQHNNGRCASPFETGTNKTTFSFKDNLFYCFKTGKKGNSINFVQELMGSNFIEAVNYLLTL